MTSVLRLACTLGLLTFTAVWFGCDAGNADEDLYLLDPLHLGAGFTFPEGSTAQSTTITLTLPLTFRSDDLEVGTSTLILSEGPTSLREALAEAGYEPAAIRSLSVALSEFVLEAPMGADMSFLQQVQLDLDVGERQVNVLYFEYPYGYGDRYEFYPYFHDLDLRSLFGASLRGRLQLLPYQEVPPGEFRFALRLRFELEVGTAAPAPDGLRLKQDLSVRDELRYRGVDATDVEHARVRTLRLDGYGYYGTPGEFTERVRGVTLRLGLPGEEGRMLARLDEFVVDPSDGRARVQADVDIDVTDLVRRSSWLQLTAELDLNEAAAVRGEAYAFNVYAAVEVEVPLDALEQDRAGGF